MIAFRLVLADIRLRLPLLLGTVLLLAIPVAGFLILDGFNRGIEIGFRKAQSTDLIVQETNSVGEVTGSRIAATVGRDLLDAGAPFAIPEIHAIAGTSNANAVLLRGIDLERYRSVTSFEVIEGRALERGDDPRGAFIGTVLASGRGVVTGDPIRLRGRDFTVIGVFSTGTYVDNEAWIELGEAQRLLGWGDEVSIFVIPSDGPFAPGDAVGSTLSVVPRGEFVETIAEWDPILRLSATSTFSLAVAAGIVLSMVLWRLAWLRRRDLAVLRAMGMSRSVVFGFLGLHGTAATATGLLSGIGLATALSETFRFQGLGFASRPVLDLGVIVRAAGLGALILVAATVVSGLATLRMRPVQSLRSE
jgi:putative ABC transport system permease protein